ncbi:MAG: hypothetical protein ACI9ON_000885 [Limisphaerales bacterium]|jgi:hypothetical protein
MSDALDRSVIKAARRILRPLVRLMIRNGFTATAFQELARKEFVDVAFTDFGIADKQATTSRVAVITGLSRKEVARLKVLAPMDESDQIWRNRAASVLSSWLVDEKFLDKKGDPLDLPFDGDVPNFSELVKAHSGDIPPRTIADELIRTGALEQVEGRLRMTQRGYVPSEDADALMDILGADTAELIETIDHNIQTDDERLLQAKVLAENLPAEHLQEFIRYSKQIARNTLQDLTHWLVQRDQGTDYSGQEARYEVGLGLYHIVRMKQQNSEQGFPEKKAQKDGSAAEKESK